MLEEEDRSGVQVRAFPREWMAERISFCKAERTIMRSIMMKVIMRHGVKGDEDPVGAMIIYFLVLR